VEGKEKLRNAKKDTQEGNKVEKDVRTRKRYEVFFSF